MPLNPHDPNYVAEFVPAEIAAMGPRLCEAYGVGPDAFGSKGNLTHYSGYHRSRRWILNSPDSAYGGRDYSVQTAADHGGDQDANSAADFTPGLWGSAENRRRMIEITTRVRAAARAYDRRLASVREFAGTEDGTHVVTFAGQGGADKAPFDSSHLDHTHLSFWRNMNQQDHNGIVDVMLGLDDDTMSGSFGPTQLERGTAATALPIPPVQAGTADPRETWLNVGLDGGAAGLRIWGSNGDGAWFPVDGGGAPSGLYKVSSGRIVSISLPKNLRLLSITRKALDAGGHVVEPSDTLPVYDGSIGVCFERK